MEKFERLFQPGKIGKLGLKNRIVMAPMVTGYATTEGGVTEQMINYYAERAWGGVGLIIIEATKAEYLIETSAHSNMVRIDTYRFVAGLAELVETVHLSGAKIAMQLSPGMGSWVVHRETWPPGWRPISPSNFTRPGWPSPRVLTTKEIEKLVEFYGDAALRAKAAGFDALEMHGHGSYLLAQFMSAFINKRTDKYGDLLRFPLELIESVKAKAGGDFPIIFRYSVDEFIEGGRDLEGSKVVAKRLEESGVHAIDVSAGTTYAPESQWLTPAMMAPHGCFVPLAEGLKEVVSIPVIVPGKLFDPFLAERVLQEGKADFIGIGRGLVADHEWPKKVAEGRVEDVRKCISCNEGCIIRSRLGKKLLCSVNATVGKEREYKIEPARDSKKVLVIGGGPGGMEAARVAALRGHRVTLWEKEERLGGRLIEASTPEHKKDIQPLIEWLSSQVRKAGATVEVRKEATAELVAEMKPDVVIVAIGAAPAMPQIVGIEKPNVVTAIDVLREKVKVGEEVIVVGGGSTGCDTALFLAEKGKRVTIVEMLSDIALDMMETDRGHILKRLTQKGAKWLTNLKAKEIIGEGIIAADNDEKSQAIKADTVVLALGLKPRTDLYEALKGKVPELYMIGDSVEPRKILNAIHEGFFVAYRIGW